MEKKLPKGWVETSLLKISNVFTGKKDANHGTVDGRYPFFTCAFEPLKSPDFSYDSEVMLLPGNGANVGEVFYYKGKFQAYQRTYIVDNIEINHRYLFYHLKHNWKIRNANQQYGSATNYIKIGNFNDYSVEFPPLPEQERIVAKLDKLFAQHEKIKKALDRIPQLLKAFRQQVLTQAVTGKLTEQWREGKGLEWRIEKVRDVTNYNPRYSWDDQTCLSFVEMANLPIRLFSPLKSIKRKFIDVKKGYRRFSNSDVLLAKITPCFENGKSAVADGLLNGIGCGSSEYYVFRCKEGLLPYFLLFHFKRTVFLVEGADNMNGAVGQQRVTQEFVLNYEISIPPPQEQQEIVHRVESLFTKADAIEARYHILKAKIDNLPQALLYKAFKGELVPQLPSDGDAKDLLEEILTLKKEVKRSKKK